MVFDTANHRHLPIDCWLRPSVLYACKKNFYCLGLWKLIKQKSKMDIKIPKLKVPTRYAIVFITVLYKSSSHHEFNRSIGYSTFNFNIQLSLFFLWNK